ncbi:MAG TPA: AMP-binding protein, partial [Kofleriaceae bacterium]
MPGGEGAANNFAAWLFEIADSRSIALLDEHGEVTFGDLEERVREVAAFVQQHRQGRSAIVPIVGEPTLRWVSAYLGVMYAGAVAAPLPQLSASAMEHVLAETSAPLVLGPGYVSLDDIPTTSRLAAPVAMAPDALALLLYTSGSTGRPRGVMLSSRNLGANAEAILGFCPLTPADRALVALPFYYCYGASVLHTHLRAGASLAFPRSGYQADILDGLERWRVTGLPSVSTMLDTLSTRGTLRKHELSRLRWVMASGGV